MKKAIIILDGISAGKNIFTETTKTKYWLWSTNHRNRLSFCARKLHWDQQKDKRYYDFVDDLEKLANSYFNYQEEHVFFMLKRFRNCYIPEGSPKRDPEIMIIHNLREDLIEILKEEYQNTFYIYVGNEDAPQGEIEFDYELNMINIDYEKNILNLLETITKDEGEN